MIEQLKELYRSLSVGARLTLAGMGVMTLLAIGVVFLIAGAPRMEPAFTRLDGSTASALAGALREAKVTFELADGGATILVPSGELSAARVAAAAAGLGPDASAPGFELFDQGNLGMGQFEQQVTYQRALAGELEKTIEGFNGVARARVAIVPAEKSLFVDRDRPSTASVALALEPGITADRALVRAVQATVAGAVAGMTTDAVTVVDTTGRVLSVAGADAGGTLDERRAAVEADLQAKVLGLVARTVGYGHASVAVTADLSSASSESQTTTYTPIDATHWTPVSVNRTIETSVGDSTAAGIGGVPGALSNVPGMPVYPVIPDAQPTAAPTPVPGGSPLPSVAPEPTPAPSPSASPTASGLPGYEKTTETVNYQLSNTVEHVVRQAGDIERVTVAVLLDETAAKGLDTTALRDLIGSAIGLDPVRGDAVTVTLAPFATPVPDPAPQAGVTDTLAPLMGTIQTVGALLLGLLLLVLLWRQFRGWRRVAEERRFAGPEAEAASPAGAPGAAGEPALVMPPTPLDEVVIASPQHAIQDRLRKVATENPDVMAGLVSDWLRDR